MDGRDWNHIMKVHGLNTLFKLNTPYLHSQTDLDAYFYLMGKHLHSTYFLSF